MRHTWNNKPGRHSRVTYCTNCGMKREIMPNKMGILYTTRDGKYHNFRAGECKKNLSEYIQKTIDY